MGSFDIANDLGKRREEAVWRHGQKAALEVVVITCSS